MVQGKKKYNILVADDSETYLKIIQKIFEIVGSDYELTFAYDGKQAVELATEHIPDLVLCDVIMPELNGIEVVRVLRANKTTANIPIIVLSATESLEAAYEVGADDFISKPFKQFELLIKVRSAIKLVDQIKEIEKQHEEVILQRDQIAIQKKDIIDDIRYSKHIQNAILPTHEDIKSLIDDYFILDIPRNIVSGDFYWVGRNNGKKVIALADCTGHGISGAFMTMAGTAFLNEIMGKNKKLEAHQILFELRVHVMKLLKQTGEEGEASDGMDIALTILDETTNKIQFAGANNPFYLVRDNKLEIYKGDRMPIGIHHNFNQPFHPITIKYKKGDLIYLFSDGYVDQFGGPKNKKFRYKQFQELIISIHKKPMEEQKRILLETHLKWKGEEEQIDDILILGYRL